MKNLTVLLVSSMLILGAFSINAESSGGWSNGHFFVGGAVGYNRPNDINFNNYLSDGTISATPRGQVNASNLSNVISKVYGGFVWNFNRYELAIDGYIQGSTENKQSFNATAATTDPEASVVSSGEIKQKAIGYGIEIKPGYYFTKKMKIAAVLGYGWSPYSIMTTDSIMEKIDTGETALIPIPGTTSSSNFNGGHIISGLELGYQLEENLSFNITYEHDFYSNENLSVKKNINLDGKPTQYSSNADGLKNSNAIYAGIRYQF